MRKFKEYDNRERRMQMKAKKVRKVFERRYGLTSYDILLEKFEVCQNDKIEE